MKAQFGYAFLHFIEEEWRESLFTKNFYNRLSMCFGHIAHYVEGVIMRSVDARTASEFSSDAITLRIIPCCKVCATVTPGEMRSKRQAL
jgi:hypothetical protein